MSPLFILCAILLRCCKNASNDLKGNHQLCFHKWGSFAQRLLYTKIRIWKKKNCKNSAQDLCAERSSFKN